MADDEHAEEQEMEAEALAAIFDTSFEVISPNPPLEWGIRLWPEQETGGDDGDANHVGIRLLVKLPPTYPDEGSAPKFTVEILKGLTTEHAASLETMALEEAESNGGMPVLYAVCEKLKEWLLENNEKGLDDRSAYAQMMAREKEKEREKQKAALSYEAQKAKEVMTEAEAIDLEVRKRRAEGTPCTDETFYAWRDKFDAEMKEKDLEAAAQAAAEKGAKSGAEKEVDKSGRLTGFQQFSDTSGNLNLEAMEAAAENAERDPDEDDDEDLEDVDEDLFVLDDDDLDDLDFGDDDDDDEDEQPDI